jgi:hypothetical protein
VTISTAAPTALIHRAPPAAPGRRFRPLALAFVLLLGVDGLRRRGKMLRGLFCVLVFLGAGLAIAALSGCSAVLLQVPQSYAVTVTATAGSLQHTAAVSLNVK